MLKDALIIFVICIVAMLPFFCVIAYLDHTKPVCWHQKQVAEYNGSFHEITLHHPNCPKLDN